MRATLGFLEKLTYSPKEIGPTDVAPLRVEGLTDQAIRDAIYVCVGFNIITRIADALDFKVPPPKVFASAAKYLLAFGYQTLSGLQLGRNVSRHDQTNVDQMMDDGLLSRRDALTDPYVNKLKRLKYAVVYGPGALDPAVRKIACVAGEIPGAPGSYVTKVAQRAYEITNADITALCQTGYSEDQIFELTVSAALGAGLVRLRAALNALLPHESSFNLSG